MVLNLIPVGFFSLSAVSGYFSIRKHNEISDKINDLKVSNYDDLNFYLDLSKSKHIIRIQNNINRYKESKSHYLDGSYPIGIIQLNKIHNKNKPYYKKVYNGDKIVDMKFEYTNIVVDKKRTIVERILFPDGVYGNIQLDPKLLSKNKIKVLFNNDESLMDKDILYVYKQYRELMQNYKSNNLLPELDNSDALELKTNLLHKIDGSAWNYNNRINTKDINLYLLVNTDSLPKINIEMISDCKQKIIDEYFQDDLTKLYRRFGLTFVVFTYSVKKFMIK